MGACQHWWIRTVKGIFGSLSWSGVRRTSLPCPALPCLPVGSLFQSGSCHTGTLSILNTVTQAHFLNPTVGNCHTSTLSFFYSRCTSDTFQTDISLIAAYFHHHQQPSTRAYNTLTFSPWRCVTVGWACKWVCHRRCAEVRHSGERASSVSHSCWQCITLCHSGPGSVSHCVTVDQPECHSW